MAQEKNSGGRKEKKGRGKIAPYSYLTSRHVLDEENRKKKSLEEGEGGGRSSNARTSLYNVLRGKKRGRERPLVPYLMRSRTACKGKKKKK